MQEYFAGFGIAQDFFSNSYARISYIAKPGKDNAKITKFIYRQRYY